MPASRIRAQYEIGQPWEDWAPMARAYGPIRSEADMIRALRFIQYSSRELRENQELLRLIEQHDKDPAAYKRRLFVQKRLAKSYQKQFK